MHRQAMLKPQQAADRLGISPVTLRYWRMLGQGPRYIRLTARNFRYAENDIDAYVAARTYDPTVRAALEIHAHRSKVQ